MLELYTIKYFISSSHKESMKFYLAVKILYLVMTFWIEIENLGNKKKDHQITLQENQQLE